MIKDQLVKNQSFLLIKTQQNQKLDYMKRQNYLLDNKHSESNASAIAEGQGQLL